MVSGTTIITKGVIGMLALMDGLSSAAWIY
jgi:hypothetical protein